MNVIDSSATLCARDTIVALFAFLHNERNALQTYHNEVMHQRGFKEPIEFHVVIVNDALQHIHILLLPVQQLRAIKRSLTGDNLKALVQAFVRSLLTRLLQCFIGRSSR